MGCGCGFTCLPLPSGLQAMAITGVDEGGITQTRCHDSLFSTTFTACTMYQGSKFTTTNLNPHRVVSKSYCQEIHGWRPFHKHHLPTCGLLQPQPVAQQLDCLRISCTNITFHHSLTITLHVGSGNELRLFSLQTFTRIKLRGTTNNKQTSSAHAASVF